MRDETPRSANAPPPSMPGDALPASHAPHAAPWPVRLARALDDHRGVAVAGFVVVLLGASVLTLVWTPTFESTAVVIPLDHDQVVYDWLTSRQAAAHVLRSVGDPLRQALAAQADANVSDEARLIAALQDSTSIRVFAHDEDARPRFAIGVALESRSLAQRAVAAYLSSLEILRPRLEDVAEAALFERYLVVAAAPDAEQRAAEAAARQEFWLVFDEPSLPLVAVSPNRVLLAGGAIVSALALAVLAALTAQWLSATRAAVRASRDPAAWQQWRAARAAASTLGAATLRAPYRVEPGASTPGSASQIVAWPGDASRLELRVTVVKPTTPATAAPKAESG